MNWRKLLDRIWLFLLLAPCSLLLAPCSNLDTSSGPKANRIDYHYLCVDNGMTRRPLPIWCRYMHKEDPPKADRRKLISEHQKGGCKFEEGVVTDMMGDAKIKQGPNWDVKTGQELWWIYIGKFWWCRKNKKRYEFARLYAIKYEDDTKFIDGLWNEVRHGDKQQPKIVYKDKKKGYVVGHNKFEILVQWEDDYMRRSVQKPYSSLDGISFEFEEDEQYFKKLLNKKEKQDGESPSTTSNSKEEDCTAQ